jgi:wyosine [tRNA(Phe)-imidazoG37] synthetase (radical SAM superfamily)
MSLLPQHAQHERQFAENKYVYPVLSRRSQGISIGVNLNPDKVCNFDCIYCQVDRTSQAETTFVDLPRLEDELRSMLAAVQSGAIWTWEKFRTVPEHLRRINDIAFSGDGEPTTFKNFDQLMQRAAELKQAAGLSEVKLVLITNASMFHRPVVQRGLAILDENNGEIWAKLDAGTDEYYHLIERTVIPFQQILENITAAAKLRPLVIQALFMRVNNEPPSQAEQLAFCERLREITQAGGQLKLIQLYTVARKPAESIVTPLSNTEVDAFVSLIQAQTGLPVQGYYGMS